MGFAEQVMELEIRLEEEESLELIQILSQMYKVDVL
jgi:ribonucleotide reductase alpha subunit